MVGSVGRSIGWVASVLVRLAFVVAIVSLTAGFALGGADLSSGINGVVGDALGASGGNDTSYPASMAGGLNGTQVEYLVHEGVNRKRTQHNRSNLSFDTDLRSVARYHSADMANRSYFAHTAPRGQTVADRYDKFDYRCRVWTGDFSMATGGENILMTYYESPVTTEDGIERYTTPEELANAIVEGWMNSPEHRENLLKRYWNREAIGVNVTTQNGRTQVNVTQNFC